MRLAAKRQSRVQFKDINDPEETSPPAVMRGQKPFSQSVTSLKEFTQAEETGRGSLSKPVVRMSRNEKVLSSVGS